ncbi:MAG TPA: ABC transporter ATP-binding protein [Blastocatellia bacterium]|nr:ABC transporter ATP-binding protein [Blastocatellia bacterium]
MVKRKSGLQEWSKNSGVNMVATVTQDNTVIGQSEAPRAAVRCSGLVKEYPDVKAVNGLDLEVRAGECFGLLGPNGAGKTTTVEILEGLTPADAGTVELLGKQWGAGADYALRQRIGVQLQETQLADKLTVEETLRLFRSFYRHGREVDVVIATVALEEKRRSRVGKLSGGQRQRLAVACALVSDPELLFLDEPTTGLDPQARLKLWEIVEQFRAGGGTIVLTTHYMEEATRLCERVAIMDHGRVIALGSPNDLIQSLGADQIVEFSVKGDLDSSRLGSLPGVRYARQASASHCLTVSDTGAALPALLEELGRQNARIDTLTTHQATLEDVFVSLTGRTLRDG